MPPSVTERTVKDRINILLKTPRIVPSLKTQFQAYSAARLSLAVAAASLRRLASASLAVSRDLQRAPTHACPKRLPMTALLAGAA